MGHERRGRRDALAAGVDSERSPLLVFDRETMSEAAFGNMAAVLDELHVSIAVGVMSETPDDHERTAGFPLTISMSARATEEDWRRLAAVGEVSAPTAASAGGQIPASRTRSLRILVAEDNRTNQEVARRLLERAGHQVEIAAQGEEAVEMLERQTFDLVLMDINMPVMNGYEATKLHRFASLGRRHVPIYALTADVTPETRERSREAGMQGCLHKPIDMAELQAVLDAVGRAAQPDNGNGAAAPAAPAATFAPAPADEAPAFDAIALVDAGALRGLAELGGASFVSELAAQFIADAWRKIDELDHAAALHDAASFRDVTHSLRSSAANLGARRLFAMCLEWRALGAEELAAQGGERIAALRATLLETEAELTAAAALW